MYLPMWVHVHQSISDAWTGVGGGCELPHMCGNQTQVLCKSGKNSFNSGAISPAPQETFGTHTQEKQNEGGLEMLTFSEARILPNIPW